MIPNTPPVSSISSSERGGSKWPKRIGFIIIGLVAVGSLFQNYRLSKELAVAKTGQNGDPNALQKTLDAIGKLMILPTGETPTVATVSDLSKLKDQPFFANAQIGDQVIIYSQSKKAILWRPSNSKIVEVAPININAQAQNETQNQAASAATANEPVATKTEAKPKR